ncbi:hypothetical protein RRG08_047707 [Elysia crispata]|uniref:Uncharacterized protein n=1 Tax=Elysia crispata TaxID=231223 RepID=A0AAE0YK70_9GAST|nr:hypothetical protein RRG08_047707 [Elysia crispata]
MKGYFVYLINTLCIIHNTIFATSSNVCSFQLFQHEKRACEVNRRTPALYEISLQQTHKDESQICKARNPRLETVRPGVLVCRYKSQHGPSSTHAGAGWREELAALTVGRVSTGRATGCATVRHSEGERGGESE